MALYFRFSHWTHIFASPWTCKTDYIWPATAFRTGDRFSHRRPLFAPATIRRTKFDMPNWCVVMNSCCRILASIGRRSPGFLMKMTKSHETLAIFVKMTKSYELLTIFAKIWLEVSHEIYFIGELLCDWRFEVSKEKISLGNRSAKPPLRLNLLPCPKKISVSLNGNSVWQHTGTR
jgi:hypothetical protein